MSKKPAKAAKPAKSAPAAPADPNAPPKKRSKLKLALFALVPLLLLGGGGYAGWTFFLAAPATAQAAHGAEGDAAHGEAAAKDGHGGDGVDAGHVAALPTEIAAETSFTYSYALSELLKERCGATRLTALKAASDEEATGNGLLANYSWVAANRRLGTITEESCGYMRSEIAAADAKAAGLAAEKAGGDKADKADKGH